MLVREESNLTFLSEGLSEGLPEEGKVGTGTDLARRGGRTMQCAGAVSLGGPPETRTGP